MRITIDAQAYEVGNRRMLQDLQKAAALTLTDTAKFANADFIKELTGKVDRPAPFTVRPSGYGITIAKFGAVGDALFSEAFVKPAQSRYIQFIIDGGGIRGLGDAGASKKHAWVPGQRTTSSLGGAYSVSPRLSKYGGIPNSYSSNLYDMWKRQQAAAKGAVRGMSAAGFAMTLRTPGATTGTAAYSKGGVFYGTIKGKTGFWARPKRAAPLGGRLLERADTKKSCRLRLRPTLELGDPDPDDHSATVEPLAMADIRDKHDKEFGIAPVASPSQRARSIKSFVVQRGGTTALLN